VPGRASRHCEDLAIQVFVFDVRDFFQQQIVTKSVMAPVSDLNHGLTIAKTIARANSREESIPIAGDCPTSVETG
jgi:hypothetical protein